MILPATLPRGAAGRNLRRQLLTERMPVRFARHGDLLPLTLGAEAQVLYPPDGVGGKGKAADRALAMRFETADWRVWWLAEGDGAAVAWLLAHERPDTLGAAVLVTSGAVSADWLRAVQPRLVILRPNSSRADDAPEEIAPILPTAVETIAQSESGAVTLDVYPDRIDARGFVDGRKVTLRK